MLWPYLLVFVEIKISLEVEFSICIINSEIQSIGMKHKIYLFEAFALYVMLYKPLFSTASTQNLVTAQIYFQSIKKLILAMVDNGFLVLPNRPVQRL